MIVNVNTQDIQVGKRHRLGRDIESLAESIQRLGLLNPITVTEDHVLVAGHRRLCACKLLEWAEVPCNVVDCDAELAEIDENLMRDDLTVLERSEHLARRKEIYEAVHPGTRKGGDRKSEESKSKCNNCTLIPAFAEDTAAKVGVSKSTVQHEVQIANDLTPEVRDMIRDTPLADVKKDLIQLARMEPEQQVKVAEMIVSGEAKSVADGQRQAKRKEVVAKLEGIAARETVEPTGLYDVVVIDPPWPMTKIDRDCTPNQVAFDYPTMDEMELQLLTIPMADDCHLFLWTTQRFLPMALDLLKVWGTKYVFTMVWCKAGGFQPFGLPQYNAEFCLYAHKGNPVFVDTKDFKISFHGERREHSRKPVEFYNTITRVTAGRRLDMFAREQRDKWDVWGNEV